METDLNGMKKAASQNATDLSEFKVTVERGFEETLNKQRELNTKVLQDLNDRVDTHEENVETIRKDFEGFNFKHKQAIQLLDAKQVKMVELMSRLEKDMKVQLDQKIQFLEQNDITQQKELAGANVQIRDLKSRLVAVVNEVDQKVLTQQQI